MKTPIKTASEFVSCLKLNLSNKGFFVMSDGESLHIECARDNQHLIAPAIIQKRSGDGWLVVGMETENHNHQRECAECQCKIPASKD